MPKFPKLNQKTVALPGWLFTAFMVLYCELILHLWITDSLHYGRLAAVIAFALGCGSLLGLLCSFLKPKAGKRVSVAIGFALAVLYLTEYFLSDAYQNFMTFQTIVAGAGGVAQDYFALVMDMLLRNLWRIGLMLLPVAAYGLWGRNVKSRWKGRTLLACFCAVCYLLGFCAVQDLTTDAEVLGSAYNFDSAVRHLGLNMGLTLDAIYSAIPEGEPEFAEIEVEQAPEAPEETEPVEYGYNVLPIDFGAAAIARGQKEVDSIHEYVNSLTPAKKNPYTGLFAGKNLILITAEAFSAEVIDPELTPTLYRMANEGIKFTEYYQPAWGASTTTGEFSNLIGLVPMNGGSSMNEVKYHDMFLTMGNQLQALGYYSAAFHNHLKDFYSRHQTHPHLGYDKFVARYGGLEGLSDCWPESDLEMIDLTITDYIDKQPFSVYYMTVSGHCRYSTGGNAQSRKNWDLVQDLPYSDGVKAYIACNLELEKGLASLVKQLEDAGIADDTVIVMAPDHYPYGMGKAWGFKHDGLAELYGVDKYDLFQRDKNTLILWSGCLEDMDLKIDAPVCSVDILPTLSNLFGVTYDSRMTIGRDVLGDEEAISLWPDYSWVTELGTYDASKRKFTPFEGVEIPEGYVDRINAIVTNKVKFSRMVQNAPFFTKIQEELDKLQ